MKVLVTGAGGFLGAAVVRAAAGAGHAVVALHRPGAMRDGRRMAPAPLPGVAVVAGDLRQTGAWREALADIDAVIHCAAAASGDLAAQLAGTVLATENLLAALPPAVARFVHVSSFSVYDFGAAGCAGTLDETTALEPQPLRRDAYTQTKLQQEAMVRDWARQAGTALVVARPGAIYGPGKDWGYGAALRLDRFDILFAPLSRMRLIHVDNCAAALVAALTTPDGRETIVNLVDGEQPRHWAFHHRARRAGASAGWAVPVPYLALRAMGLLAALASRVFFGGRARLPEWLDLYRQQARWRPLRYANARSRALFGPGPTALRDGLRAMIPAAPAGEGKQGDG